MGVIRGIFKARDKPINNMNGSQYSFFFAGTTAGKPVNEQTAMQMTAVYSCVRILSETIAGLPLHVYRYNDSGGKEKDLKHPLYKLLHDEPNPEMTSFAFREKLMSHLLLWGNAYAQIIRNARGEVIALYPLMPIKEFARRIGAKEEEAFFIGNGSGKPTGIFNATGGAETGITTASATAIIIDEIMDLFYSLKSSYRKNATFVMNDATVKAIRKLKDGSGNYIWQPSLTAGTPDTNPKAH